MTAHDQIDTSSPPADPKTPGGPSSRFRRPGFIVALSVITALVLGAVIAVALGPRATLGSERAGDPTLIRDVEATVGTGRGLQSLSVARIQDGTTSFAGLGALETVDGEGEGGAPGPHTPYELGSITKTWTGMLLADAVERGEMEPDAPISTYLTELAGTPAGGVTAEQLATHTSGLPRLPEGDMASGLWAVLNNANPYDGWTTDKVIESAGTAQLADQGTFSYSNLGMALLGHAEARAAGAADWPSLVRERILTPLQMTETVIAADDSNPTPGLATPHLTGGMETSHWWSSGYDPAGSSTRTTAADMAKFADAVLRGRAPGGDALTPRADASNGRKIGLAWITTDSAQGPFLWHNGGSGGTSTMMTIDREAGTAAVVLGNSATSVDEVGIGLIRPGVTVDSPAANAWSWMPVAIAVVLVGLLWWKAWRGRSRMELADGVVDGASAAVLVWTRGAWDVLPEWALGSILAAAFVGGVYALMRMREAPTWPRSGRAGAIVNLVFSLLILAFFALAL